MNKTIFWRNWNKTDKILITGFFILICLAAFYLFYGYFYGLSNIISWEVKKNLVPVAFDNLYFETGALKIRMPIDQYIIFQLYNGSILKINPVFWSIYLVFFVASFNLILGVLSGISKFWFYGTMGAFIGFVILMQPDHIQLFGANDKSASILILSIYLTVGYIFREFKPEYSLMKRFVIFVAASFLIGIIIYFFSGVPKPFSYIISYGIGAPLLASVIFIFTISHEIIFAFLLIVSGTISISRRNNVLHFTILSVIYLAYIFITYLYNTSVIDWNLVYLNPLIILCISVFGGFWWLKHRENLYIEILPYSPSAALLYLGFGVLALSTYGFILSVGNDPIAESFEDSIIYGQLGFGIMFYLYVIANFTNLMMKGYNVVPLTYKSKTIPFFAFRLGGLIITGFLLFQSGFFPFFQARAGYYNLIGDLFWEEGRTGLAEEYYIMGSEFEFQNHRSNYALASVARMKGNKAEEIYYLENANLKKPSPYAYINISNKFLENDQYFNGFFKLNEGYEKFPGSSRVNNNLGYFYSKTDIFDSAYYFFNQAKILNPRLTEVRSNGYALITKANVTMDFDSIVSELGHPSTTAGQVNMIALANDFGRVQDFEQRRANSDSSLQLEDFAFLYNRCLNKIGDGDTAFYAHVLKTSGIVSNRYYEIQLKLISALCFYRNHQVGRAFRILDEAALISELNTKFNAISARLYLASGDARSAADQFEKAAPLQDPYDSLYYGISLLGSGKGDSSAVIFEDLTRSVDGELKKIAGDYLDLTGSTAPGDTASDEFKYNLFRYGFEKFRETDFEEFVKSIKSQVIRDLIRLESALDLVATENYDAAANLLSNLENPEPEQVFLRSHLERIKTVLWIHDDKEDPASFNYIQIPVNDPNYLPVIMKNACIAAARKDSVSSEKYFGILSTWDPFFVEGVLSAFDYYDKMEAGGFKAYSVLYEALETNRYSVPLHREFVFQCVKLNLINYAKNSLVLLKTLMEPGEFALFQVELNQRINQSREESVNWGR